MLDPIDLRGATPIAAPGPVSGDNSARPRGQEFTAPSDSTPLAKERQITLTAVCGLAIVVGIVTGCGAVLFRDLIGLVHNLLFLGQISSHYEANVFTPASPWGPLVILVPVIGAIGVTWLVSNFAPEAKGHGVPEVIAAIYYNDGVIRPMVALIKSLASAIAIGSGAAVGREGPIIQIGSALGSSFGQIVPMSVAQRIILVAAGAASGIAATFNTPIGGVLFATELMLPEISVDSFLPVALATGTATFVGRMFLGSAPAFNVPRSLVPLGIDLGSFLTLLLYAGLGAVIGVAAAAFIRSLHVAETAFEHIGGRYRRHMFGMLLVGILIALTQRGSGHYHFEGVGYSTIQWVLGTGAGAASVWFLLFLFAGKLLATSLSLGSGSSGGVFSPSLFMGTVVGAAFAGIVRWLAPQLPVDPAACAIVGMGAMVGSGTGAAMTAVCMVFEMTLDYTVVLPMIIAVATALGTRRLLSRETIYTMKLVRRGQPIPQALHANMFVVHNVASIMDRNVIELDSTATSADLCGMLETHPGATCAVLMTADRISGFVDLGPSMRLAVEHAPKDFPIAAWADRRFILSDDADVVLDVLSSLHRRKANAAFVESRATGKILGVITHEAISQSVASGITLYR